jgi:arsenite methyltransferase
MAEPFFDEDMARKQERLAATPDMASQRRFMMNLLGPKAGEEILDVGSGNGIFVREIAALVGDSGHACGVDSSEPIIRMARHIAPQAEFLHGDATDLPVEDASFDVVTASQLLCFVADVGRALAEMARALRPGGRAVILDTDWGSLVWNCRDRDLMDRAIALLTGPYADAHVPRTLTRRLSAAGFRVVGRHSFTVLNWDRSPDTYAGQTAGFIEAMMGASDAFTKADWDTWDADQEAMMAAGDFMFSLNRYAFTATKP